MIDCLTGCAGNRTVGARDVSHSIGVDCEVCSHTDACDHISIRAWVVGAAVTPVHKMVVEISDCFNLCGVGPMIDCLTGCAGNRTVGARDVSHSIGVDASNRIAN